MKGYILNVVAAVESEVDGVHVFLQPAGDGECDICKGLDGVVEGFQRVFKGFLKGF